MTQTTGQEVLILHDRDGRFYKIPVDALAGFQVPDAELAKVSEALGMDDTQGFATWKDVITYKSGGYTDKLEGLAYRLIWQ